MKFFNIEKAIIDLFICYLNTDHGDSDLVNDVTKNVFVFSAACIGLE